METVHVVKLSDDAFHLVTGIILMWEAVDFGAQGIISDEEARTMYETGIAVINKTVGLEITKRFFDAIEEIHSQFNPRSV